MSSVFYSFNYVDDATLSATNENASFPVTNLQDSRRTKGFRSTTSSTDITVDIGSTEDVDSFVIVGHPIDGFGFTGDITLEGNATSNFTSPAFTTTITSATDIDADDFFGFKEFATQSYRFWRVRFNGSAYVEVNNIFIGKKVTLGDADINLSWTYVNEDLSKSAFNRTGQKFVDIIDDQKMIEGEIVAMNKTEVDNFFLIYDHNKTYKPIYFRFEGTFINDIGRFSGMYFLDKMPTVTNIAPNLYSSSLTLKEAK